MRSISKQGYFCDVINERLLHLLVFSGIKLVNLYTNKCVKVIGKNENLRCVHVALCQMDIIAAPSTVEETASENPNLQV